jgi:hypothetical protein
MAGAASRPRLELFCNEQAAEQIMSSKANRGLGMLVGAFLSVLASIGASWAGPKKPVDGWTFEVSPYLWMTSLSGTVGVFERVPPTSVDFTFNKIFNHIDWPAAIMLSGEARNGRFGILGDFMYVALKAEAATPGPLFSTATVKVSNLTTTVEGAYRIVDSPSVQVDGLAGARLFSVGLDLNLSSGLLAGRSGSLTNTWVDPVIGVRVLVPFGSGFYVSGYGDVGGFGISGGDMTWQFAGNVGYNFNDWLTAYAGFRYLNIQHQDGGFVYDVQQEGPMLGATFRF